MGTWRPVKKNKKKKNMYNVVDQDNYNKDVSAYDQFFGDDVCLPDERGRHC